MKPIRGSGADIGNPVRQKGDDRSQGMLLVGRALRKGTPRPKVGRAGAKAYGGVPQVVIRVRRGQAWRGRGVEDLEEAQREDQHAVAAAAGKAVEVAVADNHFGISVPGR